MRRLFLLCSVLLIMILTVFLLYRADLSTKQVAGFLDSNVFFAIDLHSLTVLNQTIRLR